MSLGKLNGKVAIVTGGASGIGEATAHLFAAHGARGIVIADIQDDKGQAVAASIGSQRCTYIHCNVSDEDQVRSMVESTVQVYGQLDIMFSNSGIASASFQKILDLDFSQYDRLLSINARKYNIFMAQIGSAALGVSAFDLFGPRWLVCRAGLATAIAFIFYARAIHPPVVEVLENLAYLATASNLVLYLTKLMHYSPSNSANMVTNFMGTAFLLALLGGFLADAYITTYRIYLISATIEFLGLLLLTLQAHTPSLIPQICTSSNRNAQCEQIGGGKTALLFTGLYLVALGVGGIKGSLPPHGAEQFDESTKKGRKQRSTFFNYFVFSLSFGALIAVTFVVWVEDNKGWQWGFGISTASILISIPIFLLGSPTYRMKVPKGSPITTIFKVLAAAIWNAYALRKTDKVVSSMKTTPSRTTNTGEEEYHSKNNEQIRDVEMDLTFLGKALMNNHNHPAISCTKVEVDEVKIVLKILPIFASTITLNCCLAQLSTFSVQQAATMNTKIGSLKVPPASLPVFPVLFMMALAPIYSHVIVPFARKLTKTEMGITHLQRIGMGLVLSIIAMAVAAIVEVKRKRVADKSALLNSTKPLPVTFLWIALQYLFLGSADLFSLAGMMEFFFTEAPFSMRSLAASLSWASLAMGYYMSSVLVSIVNRVTGSFWKAPWLSGNNLNHYRLDRFYWLMCVLSGLNFLHYLLWATRYKYRTTFPDNENETQPVNKPSEV